MNLIKKIRPAVLSLAVPALALTSLAGCKSNPSASTQAPITDASTATDPNADPAAANLPPAGALTSSPTGGAPAQSARVLGARTEAPQYGQNGESYAPAQQQGYQGPGAYQGPGDPNGAYQSDVDAGQDAIYAQQPPPPLPVYEQPPAPDPNDEWTPGYWNYGAGGYYWVPGVWVSAPYTGALWTPPYWGFYGGRYGFHRGYWGLHIGFYGGVPYGFGYTGLGYEGGYWHGNDFYYNRAVNRIDPNIHNVYEHNVTIVNNYNRVSYNGGPGGIAVRPRPSEQLAFREQHTPAMQTQIAVAREASTNRAQFYTANHGQPQQIARAQPVLAVRGIQAPPRVNYTQGAAANLQQRTTNEQQRGVNEQQQNQNLQQRNANEQPQRGQQEPQRTQQPQQRNPQQAPQTQQREAQQQQQRNVQEQQRAPQAPQRNQVAPQRQAQPQAQPQRQAQSQPQREAPAPRAQPAPQTRPEPAPQARPQAAPPARPPAPAPRPAPAAHPAPAPHEEGGHPKR